MSKEKIDESLLKRGVSQKIQKASFVKNDHFSSDRSLFSRINWLNVSILFVLPAIAFYGAIWKVEKHMWQTWLWAFFLYLWCGYGITAGYHRHYSHRAYRITNPLVEIILMAGGTGALQGSCKWWSLLHRSHHRYTDTDDDPYNAKRGFWYAHFGWMILDEIRVKRVIEMSDLKANWIVRFQHRHYHWLGPFMALVFPTLVAGLGWGDWRGGFYISACLRVVALHHATWCVNSFAHFFGEHKFDDTITARDSLMTALITLGEGNHNYHHEFPNDYRNGVYAWDYDPTKWLINAIIWLGFVEDAVTFDMNGIRRGELDMKQKRLNAEKESIDYGVPIESLPFWSENDLKIKMDQDKKRTFIVFAGIVHDVSQFLKENKHPAGKKIIRERNGLDVTEDVNGAIYNHTNAARNLMSHMRVARLVPSKKSE